MDGVVEDVDVLFPDVFSHLQQVEAEPATKILDEELLKRAERSLDTSTSPDLLWKLLTTGQKLLQSLQQDPTPLTRLLERTVLCIPFDQLKTSISAEKLEEGLLSPSKPVQLLCLTYLRKASDSPSGASFVACSPSLVKTLVTKWLASESTEVAERSLEDIVALLAVDHPRNVTVMFTSSGLGEADGHGLFWRVMFNDPEVYSLLFQWTSFVKSNHGLNSKKGRQAITISQARLFDYIIRVASLDWPAITTTVHRAIESDYSQDKSREGQPFGGLLKYAANGMIDKDDYLMEMLRQDFFMKLLQVIEDNNSKDVSPRLRRAIQEGAGIQETTGEMEVQIR